MSLCVGLLARKEEVKENKDELSKSHLFRGGIEETIHNDDQEDANHTVEVCFSNLEPDHYPEAKDNLKSLNKKSEEVVEQVLFNYNLVKPRMVSDNVTIDYLKPLNMEEEQGLERMSESFFILDASERMKECTGLEEVRRLNLLQIQQYNKIVDNMANRANSLKAVNSDVQVSNEVKSEKVAKKDSFNYNSVKPSRVSSGASNYLAPLRTAREQELGQLFESTDEDKVAEAAIESSVLFELRKTNSQQLEQCSDMLRFCKEREKEEAEQLIATGPDGLQVDVAGEFLESLMDGREKLE